MEISLLGMSGLLGLVIFCPLILAEILKRFAPDFTAKLSKGQYSIALVSFVITNLGIFSRYGVFLREEQSTVLISLGVSVILAVAYFVAGMLFSLGRPLPDHLALIIGFGFINNVLVLVLSSEFFSPIEVTVAAIYTIPFFGLIVPLRLYQNWAKRQGTP
jgi:BASS family bile acid:Na+ symporter